MPTIIDWNLPVRTIERESISYKHLTKCQESGSSMRESLPIEMEEDSTYLSSQKSSVEGPPGRSTSTAAEKMEPLKSGLTQVQTLN